MFIIRLGSREPINSITFSSTSYNAVGSENIDSDSGSLISKSTTPDLVPFLNIFYFLKLIKSVLMLIKCFITLEFKI